MEIPIAVAVGAELSEAVVPVGAELSEAVPLKQKQDDLSAAEEELERVLSLSSDFFATLEERDATYAHIQANLSAAYKKPFMKKIVLAYAKVKRCADDVAWASESVVDTTLTPAQVKAQLKQLLEHQRTTLERKMEDRLQAERAEWTKQVKELREELATERRHRKAFQTKVKDFSDYVYLKFAYDTHHHTLFPKVHKPDKFQYQMNIIYGGPMLSKHLNLLRVPEDSEECRLKLPFYVKYRDLIDEQDVYGHPLHDILPSFDGSDP